MTENTTHTPFVTHNNLCLKTKNKTVTVTIAINAKKKLELIKKDTPKLFGKLCTKVFELLLKNILSPSNDTP